MPSATRPLPSIPPVNIALQDVDEEEEEEELLEDRPPRGGVHREVLGEDIAEEEEVDEEEGSGGDTGQESLWSEEGNGQDVEMAEDIQPEDPGQGGLVTYPRSVRQQS
jgi:hypothetical protein